MEFLLELLVVLLGSYGAHLTKFNSIYTLGRIEKISIHLFIYFCLRFKIQLSHFWGLIIEPLEAMLGSFGANLTKFDLIQFFYLGGNRTYWNLVSWIQDTTFSSFGFLLQPWEMLLGSFKAHMTKFNSIFSYEYKSWTSSYRASRIQKEVSSLHVFWKHQEKLVVCFLGYLETSW